MSATAVAIWFGLLALDGMLRHVTLAWGIPWLVYVKDGLLLGLLAVLVIQMAVAVRIHMTILVVLVVVAYGGWIGAWNGASMAAVLFGAKMFLPFLAGYFAISRGYLPSVLFTGMYRIIIPVMVAGILLDLFYELPWTGATYELGGVVIESSRQWGTFGLERAAGFGRSSFESAICLYSLLILRFALPKERSVAGVSVAARIGDSVIGLAAVLAVVVTTSKTSLLALLFLAAVAFIRLGFRHSNTLMRQSARAVVGIMCICAFVYALAPFLLPLGSPAMLDDFISERGPVARILLQSFVERVQDVWPRAFASLDGPFTPWTGRGLGNVGAPQLYFSPASYNPADNVYVYVLLAFGSVVLASLLGYLVFLALRLFRSRPPDAPLLVFLASFLVFGATLNVVEAPALMMSLGLLLSAHLQLWDHAG